jgi:hypothetical protein
VDTVAPTATDIQTTNGGSTQGRAETNDVITFTFSEQIDPTTILAGWTGASQNVVVRIDDGGCTLVLCSADTFTIETTGGATLPFGSVDLNRADYNGDFVGLGSDADLTYNATMVQSGSVISITLGSNTGGSPNTADGAAGMVWSPSATAKDPAGNAMSTSSRTETGSSDKDF